jgi:hypothetical protein
MINIPLAHTKKGVISLTKIEQPYGPKSDPVVSIGISIAGGETPDYKVHIPIENIDDLISALKTVKS